MAEVENTTVITKEVQTTKSTDNATPMERYPAMQFMIRFAKLLSTILAFFFLISAVISIFTGIFSEDASIIWGFVNAGMTLLIGAVLIALVKGMGEVFEVLLELEKRK